MRRSISLYLYFFWCFLNLFPRTQSTGVVSPYSGWSLICFRASPSSPNCQPLHTFSLGGGREQASLSTNLLSVFCERKSTSSEYVYKNGQLFQNRFSGKRTIPWPSKFQKMYLTYLPFWRVRKHINILKICGALPSVWPREIFCFAANITIKETDFWTQIVRFS